MTDPSNSHLDQAEAVRELIRLARFDRRRGVELWSDPDLTDALRELVREAVKAQGPSSKASGSAKPAARPSKSGADRPATEAEAAAGLEMLRQAIAKPASAMPPEKGPTNPPASRPAPKSGKSPKWGAPPLAIGRDADWEEKLEALGARAAGCTACQLSRTRKNVAFGVGSARIPLVFVGEAPGADEDAQGIPFVGRAGQLLTKIISAIGIDRDEVYICNVLKCRPPGNRNPAPDEITTCTPFLSGQLEILKPRVICTLGLFASQFLLESTMSMGRMRGQIFDYKGIPVIPTYHPAALLRNPDLKAKAWEDVQLVRKKLDEQ